MTNGYLQLQNFVILPEESAYPFCDASGAHRNTWLYYDPTQFPIIKQTNIYTIRTRRCGAKFAVR